MDKQAWKQYKDTKREKIMTEEEMKRVDTYITELIQNRGSMNDKYERWELEEEAYMGDQPIENDMPNTRVNIINANIEGQVSAIVEQNIAVTTRAENPSDESFVESARVGLDWALRKNRIKKIIEVHERRRLKFGTAYMKIHFNPNAMDGYGLAEITSVPLNKIFVDTKITEPLNFEQAEYICETINKSRSYAVEVYGEEKADIIDYGSNSFKDNGLFSEDTNLDNETGFILIQRWSKNEGSLRLEEFTGDGVLLYDSHKTGERKDNQKTNNENIESYYNYVNDNYPYFITPLYPEEGSLYGFGDGKLLRPLQDMINNLYDKIRIVARPDLILIGVNSDVDVEDFEEDSFNPRLCDGNPRDAVHSVKWGDVNPSWWTLLESIHKESQKITRFSDLMLGQKAKSNTATEASIQQQQGNSATDHKKTMLEETLIEVCEYMLGLMMEFHTEGRAFRKLDSDSSQKTDYDWIDFRKMTEIPVAKPATSAFRQEHDNAGHKHVKWELMEKDTRKIDLDIEVSIGAGLPKNKTFLWQMIERLSQLTSVDTATGNAMPVINYKELREFIREFLGIPLEEDQHQPQPQPPMQGQQGQPMPGQSQPKPQRPVDGAGEMPMKGADSPFTEQKRKRPSPQQVMRGGRSG